MGYAGGTKPNPNYGDLGDHSETVQVDFDPAVIPYERLLAVFWDSHDPTEPAWSRQYRSIIFYHNEAQRISALKSMEREGARRNARILTELRPAGSFTLAEDYHQKHLLRTESVFVREFRAMYPGKEGFVHSTAAARINGYLGSYGTLEDLKAELPGFGLSAEAARILTGIVGWRPARSGCPL